MDRFGLPAGWCDSNIFWITFICLGLQCDHDITEGDKNNGNIWMCNLSAWQLFTNLTSTVLIEPEWSGSQVLLRNKLFLTLLNTAISITFHCSPQNKQLGSSVCSSGAGCACSWEEFWASFITRHYMHVCKHSGSVIQFSPSGNFFLSPQLN